MKTIILSICTLFLLTTSSAQSHLEVIRASSYYSNALVQYSANNYEQSLNNLLQAEKNLQGKTNRDLEYLKIMCNYHLKNYKEAYRLVKVYFEEGFLERKKTFRNIASLSQSAGIDYEENLTALFVILEKNATNNISTDINAFIEKIVAKIKSNRVSFADYMKQASLKKVTEKIDYCLREFSNGSLKRVYENNFLTLKQVANNKKYSFEYIGTIQGKAINSSNYKLRVVFAPVKSELTSSFFSYGFEQKSVQYITGKITLKETVYECYSLTAPKREGSYFSDYLLKKFRNKNFTKRGFQSKSYKILFSKKEENLLKLDNNLMKLRIALKNNGLL